MFQFQKGAIKSDILRQVTSYDELFQFQKGAIKRELNLTVWTDIFIVSIPKRCN